MIYGWSGISGTVGMQEKLGLQEQDVTFLISYLWALPSRVHPRRAKQAAFVCGIIKGRPDEAGPLFTSLLQLALPDAPEPEANQP